MNVELVFYSMAVDGIGTRGILCDLKQRDEPILTTNSTKSYSGTQTKSEKAKLRVETALTRLEKALEEKLVQTPDLGNLSGKLDSAKREIVQLKDKNLAIAARLDSAIDKMKTILGNR